VTTHRWAALASIALLVATLAPLVRDPARDSFPLSTYPMFAAPRSPAPPISYAVGVTADGRRRELPTRAYGTSEVVQAAHTVDAALARGLPATIALCEQIAARLAGSDLAWIRIVTATHDAKRFVLDGVRGPELEQARCQVRR
jgi:hypothetical protein